VYFKNNHIDPKNFKDDILFLSEKSERTLNKIADILNFDFESYLKNKRPFVTNENLENLVKDGFTLGGHGIDHQHFFKLNIEKQIGQTMESIKFLVKNFDIDYKVFAFPYSDYGVSDEYFTKMRDIVDLFFGTSAFMREKSNFITQRFSSENGFCDLKQSISYLLTQRILRTFIGKHRIVRK
jgi:hypothetical protein